MIGVGRLPEPIRVLERGGRKEETGPETEGGARRQLGLVLEERFHEPAEGTARRGRLSLEGAVRVQAKGLGQLQVETQVQPAAQARARVRGARGPFREPSVATLDPGRLALGAVDAARGHAVHLDGLAEGEGRPHASPKTRAIPFRSRIMPLVETRGETAGYSRSASLVIASCSSTCSLWEPEAGAALASRPM